MAWSHDLRIQLCCQIIPRSKCYDALISMWDVMDSVIYLCMAILTIKRARSKRLPEIHNVQLWRSKRFGPMIMIRAGISTFHLHSRKGLVTDYHRKHIFHKYSLFFSKKDMCSHAWGFSADTTPVPLTELIRNVQLSVTEIPRHIRHYCHHHWCTAAAQHRCRCYFYPLTIHIVTSTFIVVIILSLTGLVLKKICPGLSHS